MVIHILFQILFLKSDGSLATRKFDCEINWLYWSTEGINSPKVTSFSLDLFGFFILLRKSAGFVGKGVDVSIIADSLIEGDCAPPLSVNELQDLEGNGAVFAFRWRGLRNGWQSGEAKSTP